MSGERTEKPTPKKLKDLRKKGIAARSQELPHGVGLVVLALSVPMALRSAAPTFRNDMAGFLSSAGDADLGSAMVLAKSMLRDGVRAIALPVALTAAVGVVASVLVTRQRPSLAHLRPRLQGVSPKAGVRRAFSKQGLAEAAKAAAKLAMMSGIGYWAWRSGATHLISTRASAEASVAAIGAAVMRLLLAVAGVSFAIGVLDSVLARRRYGKQSKMTKQEVRDEARQQEVNPQVKGAIRSRQYALSRQRMIQAVQAADVVLANPTHVAVALQYVPGSDAPRVIAKGAGAVAQRIKDEAREHEVPVIESKPLARAIYGAAEVGDSIPVELFRAVAEVLAVVYAARRRRGLRPHRVTAEEAAKHPVLRSGGRRRPRQLVPDQQHAPDARRAA